MRCVNLVWQVKRLPWGKTLLNRVHVDAQASFESPRQEPGHLCSYVGLRGAMIL